jgi:hypothetical protein
VGRTACTEPQCLYKGALYNKICNTTYKQLIQNQSIGEPDTATTTMYAGDRRGRKLNTEMFLSQTEATSELKAAGLY